MNLGMVNRRREVKARRGRFFVPSRSLHEARPVSRQLLVSFDLLQPSIDFAARNSRLLGYGSRGGTWCVSRGDTGLQQLHHAGAVGLYGLLILLSTGNHQHELAARSISLVSFTSLLQRCVDHLFVQLGQLARDGQRSISKYLGQIQQALRQSVGRFIDDERIGEVLHVVQLLAAVLRSSREEAKKEEAVGCQTGDRHGRDDGGGTGNRRDVVYPPRARL